MDEFLPQVHSFWSDLSLSGLKSQSIDAAGKASCRDARNNKEWAGFNTQNSEVTSSTVDADEHDKPAENLSLCDLISKNEESESNFQLASNDSATVKETSTLIAPADFLLSPPSSVLNGQSIFESSDMGEFQHLDQSNSAFEVMSPPISPPNGQAPSICDNTIIKQIERDQSDKRDSFIENFQNNSPGRDNMTIKQKEESDFEFSGNILDIDDLGEPTVTDKRFCQMFPENVSQELESISSSCESPISDSTSQPTMLPNISTTVTDEGLGFASTKNSPSNDAATIDDLLDLVAKSNNEQLFKSSPGQGKLKLFDIIHQFRIS